ncbi:MAG: DUF4236 domain-containing protein [Chloroflexia bacterium]
MGWRFRRSVRLLPGLRLNFSKRGLGYSIGRRGFRFSVGPNGRRTALSIPGTGLSYVKQGRAPRAVRRPAQVFCPYCQGGNPPAARHCIWCHKAL